MRQPLADWAERFGIALIKWFAKELRVADWKVKSTEDVISVRCIECA
jgi:hypothetical protein